MRGIDAKRLAAPAAFLLAVTIAVIVARAGLDNGSGTSTGSTVPPPPVRHRVVTTTTPKTPRRANGRFYTVVAGDTFGVIASKTGVSVSTIERLNPKVATTALVIGQRLRIR